MKIKKILFKLSLLAFVLALPLVGSTNSYFFDTEIVSGNTFRAGYWTTPPPPTPAQVVINEVYYDVDSAHQNAGTENHNEWIELYNAGPGAVDISGWIIEDDGPAVSADIIPSTPPIPADTFIVITPHSSTWGYWLTIPSEAVKIVLTSTDTKIGNGLNNQSDRVILKDNNGIEVDAVSWGTDPYAFGAGNGLTSTGPSKSIARKTKGVDTDSPDDWGVLDTPNPGTNPHLPVSVHTSTPTPNLEFSLRNDKKAVSFMVSNVSNFNKIFYEIIYDSINGERGIVGSADLAGESTFNRSDLLLGTCSGIEGKVCVYDEGITKLHLKVTLLSDGEETILEKEISY